MSGAPPGQAADRYACYGLLIASEIPLPELPAAPPETAGAAPDLVIRRGALTPADPASVDPLGLWREGAVCGIEVPGIGRYQAREGTEIVVDTAAGTDPATERLYLLGTAMGATMMLRGTLVLHGNSFRIGDGAAVVLGHSGAGKSTLAAELDRRGYDVLTDDVVPVDARGQALPGYPRIKLWPDALHRLGRDAGALERVHAEVEKFQVPLSRGLLEPLPLRWVYVLERHAGTTLSLEPVRGALAFALLREHSYRQELITPGAAAEEHLRLCGRLLEQTRVVRVARPAETMTAEATAAAILADIAGSGPSDPVPGTE